VSGPPTGAASRASGRRADRPDRRTDCRGALARQRPICPAARYLNRQKHSVDRFIVGTTEVDIPTAPSTWGSPVGTPPTSSPPPRARFKLTPAADDPLVGMAADIDYNGILSIDLDRAPTRSRYPSRARSMHSRRMIAMLCTTTHQDGVHQTARLPATRSQTFWATPIVLSAVRSRSHDIPFAMARGYPACRDWRAGTRPPQPSVVRPGRRPLSSTGVVGARYPAEWVLQWSDLVLDAPGELP
jgi:hypothetical protein